MKTYRISTEVSHRVVQGHLLLLLPDEPEVHTLNGAGRYLWERLARAASAEDELARALQRKYGLPASQAQADVRVFAEDMLRRQLWVADE